MNSLVQNLSTMLALFVPNMNNILSVNRFPYSHSVLLSYYPKLI